MGNMKGIQLKTHIHMTDSVSEIIRIKNDPDCHEYL